MEVLRQYAKRGPEPARQVGSMIFGLENALKSYEGSLKGLQDKSVMDKKRADEQARSGGRQRDSAR